MTHHIFMTGYPGFLAGSLIKQLIRDQGSDIKHFYLLILPSEREEAIRSLQEFSTEKTGHDIKFSIMDGDITKPELGLAAEHLEEIRKNVTHVFHLAAVYDLAVKERLAYRLNVYGTKMVNDFVLSLQKLERYIYYSTAYVSGTREGIIYEKELIEGQQFKNHYEATKYEAETYVDALKPMVPTTIIRPGIVKGDAETGATIKFDGLYFLLNLFDKLAASPILPYLGEGEVKGNFVPADYVLKATSYLGFAAAGTGKTYHLTDPNPYTMRELYSMLAESYLGRTPRGKISLETAKFSLKFRTVEKWLQVEKESLSYFTYDVKYDSSQAQKDLKEAGIICPDLKDTIEPMIRFYRKYKHDYKKQLQFE